MNDSQIFQYIGKQKIYYCPRSQLFRFEALTEHKTKTAKGALTYLTKNGFTAYEAIKVLFHAATVFQRHISINKRRQFTKEA